MAGAGQQRRGDVVMPGDALRELLDQVRQTFAGQRRDRERAGREATAVSDEIDLVGDKEGIRARPDRGASSAFGLTGVEDEEAQLGRLGAGQGPAETFL